MEKAELRRRFLAAVTAAERISGTRVTVHDLSGFLRGEEILLRADVEVGHHGCAFCQHIRDLPGGREACIRSDLQEGVAQACAARLPIWRRCHAGVDELVFPLQIEGKTAAVVFMGQARFPASQADVRALQMLGAEGGEAREWYDSLGEANAASAENAALLLQMALQEILLLCPKEEISLHFLQHEYSLSAQALRLVTQSGYTLSVRQTAEKLFVSPASLDRAFRRDYGVSLREYIDGTRLNLACRLIREGRQKIADVGVNVGFGDTRTFLRWFKRQMGMTPLAYRSVQTDAGPAPDLSPAGTVGDYVALCQAYLRDHFRTPVRVGQMAEKLNVSPDHLNRIFKKATGQTLTDALWQYRLEAAREELARTRAPVSWIAAQAGFPSESALDQRFRRVYGMTPGEYRRRAAKT